MLYLLQEELSEMLKEAAPEFSLESSIGESISNDDLKGAFAVLIFYPANDSPTH